MKKPLFILLLCVAPKVYAQVPTTDIYLLDMKQGKGKYSFINAKKINDWKGYNNQPYFTPDGKSIYYTSYRNKQADIYRYDVLAKQTIQFTNTPEDEYSPKLTPDGKYISVVRVMKDSSQQLWEFPVGGGTPERAIGSDSVAYYTWGHDGGIKFFAYAVVPEPMNLHGVTVNNIDTLADNKYINDNIIAKNAGRTLQYFYDNKGSYILFVQKNKDKTDSIFSINGVSSSFKIKEIVKTLPNCEDFAIGPKDILYMGSKGKLYKYQIGKDKTWKEIADFTNTPYQNFYRIAVNEAGDKIALVAYQGKKP